MRYGQRAHYAQRLDRAIALLEQRVATGDAPLLADLAAAAALSAYHFHRIFRLMTGETVGEAITRVRLAGSLSALADGGVAAGAGQSGYATTQAYARALKSATGASPAALGRDPALVEQLAGRLSAPAGAEDSALRIEIVELAPLRLLAVRNVGAYEELNGGYGRLFGMVLDQMAPENLQGIWGIPLDDPRFTPADECRFTCALDTGGLGQAAGDLEELHLPGGPHARLFLQGDYDLLHDRIDAIYATLISQDMAVGDGPLLIAYLDDAEDVAPADQRAEIHVPLMQENVR